MIVGRVTDRAPNQRDVIVHEMEARLGRRSVVPEHEILETALAHRPGAVDLGRLKERLRSSPTVIATDRGCTTHQILQQELGLITTVKDGKSTRAPWHPLFEPQSWLGRDQRTALLHVLQSGDRITGLRGLAGRIRGGCAAPTMG